VEIAPRECEKGTSSSEFQIDSSGSSYETDERCASAETLAYETDPTPVEEARGAAWAKSVSCEAVKRNTDDSKTIGLVIASGEAAGHFAEKATHPTYRPTKASGTSAS
jgi:hypothetical protein